MSSTVMVYSGSLQCTLSNKGTDFWLMFIGAAVLSTNTNPCRQISLFISSDVATGGTVSVGSLGLNQPFSVTPGQVATINLPQSVQVTTSDTLETKGIHITAQKSHCCVRIELRSRRHRWFSGPANDHARHAVHQSWLSERYLWHPRTACEWERSAGRQSFGSIRPAGGSSGGSDGSLGDLTGRTWGPAAKSSNRAAGESDRR